MAVWLRFVMFPVDFGMVDWQRKPTEHCSMTNPRISEPNLPFLEEQALFFSLCWSANGEIGLRVCSALWCRYAQTTCDSQRDCLLEISPINNILSCSVGSIPCFARDEPFLFLSLSDKWPFWDCWLVHAEVHSWTPLYELSHVKKTYCNNNFSWPGGNNRHAGEN